MDASDELDSMERQDRIQYLACAIFWLHDTPPLPKDACLRLATKLVDHDPKDVCLRLATKPVDHKDCW